MISIRRNVFETNSSSTHSISFVTDYDIRNLPKGCVFCTGDYGWNDGCVDAESYLYTAIVNYYTKEEALEHIQHLKDVMDANSIRYRFYPDPKDLKWNISTWNPERSYCCNGGSIDHSGDLKDFLEDLFSDDTKLLKYLATGKVYCTNDNVDHDINDPIYYGFKYVSNWEYDHELNPNYDSTRTFYYKGN